MIRFSRHGTGESVSFKVHSDRVQLSEVIRTFCHATSGVDIGDIAPRDLQFVASNGTRLDLKAGYTQPARAMLERAGAVPSRAAEWSSHEQRAAAAKAKAKAHGVGPLRYYPGERWAEPPCYELDVIAASQPFGRREQFLFHTTKLAQRLNLGPGRCGNELPVSSEVLDNVMSFLGPEVSVNFARDSRKPSSARSA